MVNENSLININTSCLMLLYNILNSTLFCYPAKPFQSSLAHCYRYNYNFQLAQHFPADCRVENGSLWYPSLSSGAENLTAVTTYATKLADRGPQMESSPICVSKSSIWAFDWLPGFILRSSLEFFHNHH